MNHLYEIATGRLISSTVDSILEIPVGTTVTVSNKTGIWNTVTLDFDPAPNSTIISTGAFFDRFIQSELELLINKARTNNKAAVFLKRLDLKEHIDLTDPLLIADMQSMRTAGVITTARGQEILTP